MDARKRDTATPHAALAAGENAMDDDTTVRAAAVALLAPLHAARKRMNEADREQAGLAKRFGTQLPEAMEGRLKVNPEAARLLDDPTDYVFGSLPRVHIQVDNILFADALAHRGKSSYGGPYFEAFELRAGRLLGEVLSEAASDVGSFWYTAWTAAGRPELK